VRKKKKATQPSHWPRRGESPVLLNPLQEREDEKKKLNAKREERPALLPIGRPKKKLLISSSFKGGSCSERRYGDLLYPDGGRGEKKKVSLSRSVQANCGQRGELQSSMFWGGREGELSLFSLYERGGEVKSFCRGLLITWGGERGFKEKESFLPLVLSRVVGKGRSVLDHPGETGRPNAGGFGDRN